MNNYSTAQFQKVNFLKKNNLTHFERTGHLTFYPMRKRNVNCRCKVRVVTKGVDDDIEGSAVVINVKRGG